MTIKLKPQGPKCKKFEFWTKVAKFIKPQGPKWQFTQKFIYKKYILYTTKRKVRGGGGGGGGPPPLFCALELTDIFRKTRSRYTCTCAQ
ncbi:hypothetical protein Hanom_Chr09g00811261 [Helianthus anomalus]